MILYLHLHFVRPLPLSGELRIWQVYYEVFRLVILLGLFVLTSQTVEMVFSKQDNPAGIVLRSNSNK